MKTNSLENLVSRILSTFSEPSSLHYFDKNDEEACPLPRLGDIVAVIEDLKEVFFPGYRRREQLTEETLTYYIGGLIDQIKERLFEQIFRAFMHEIPDSCTHRNECLARARSRTLAFLELIPELRRILSMDVEAAYAGDPACKSLKEVIFCYPGFDAVTVYRVAHALNELEIPLLPRMMTESAHSRTGIDIHPGAKIGKHFFIDHGTGVVIGETCIIGNWVKIYQGVTLGALSFAKDSKGELVRNTKRHPTIEDNVVIYANATVLGGETTVGRGSIIGGGVWLTESVGPETLVTLEKPALRVKTR